MLDIIVLIKQLLFSGLISENSGFVDERRVATREDIKEGMDIVFYEKGGI